MASSELEMPSQFESPKPPPLQALFKQSKEKATDLLLLRDFDGCLAECGHAISVAKSNPEMDGSMEIIESLCLIGIQAYAEMDSWQNVLPFVQQVYNGIESCPSTVIQLCILLHAKVKEYTQCHAIASIWLKCQENSDKDEYETVVRLYATDVMLPQGHIDLVPKFLSVCTLEPRTAEKIMNEVDKLSRTAPAIKQNDDGIEGIERNKVKETQSSYESAGSWILQAARRMGVMIAKQFSYISFTTVVKIAVVSVCFYLVAIQANIKDDLIASLGRASVVLQGAMQILQSLFGPVRSRR